MTGDQHSEARAGRLALKAFGMVAASLLILAPASVASPTARQFTVVFPPWWSAARAFRAVGADVAIVGGGRFGLVVIRAASSGEDEGALARLRARLRDGGAIVFLGVDGSTCGRRAA